MTRYKYAAVTVEPLPAPGALAPAAGTGMVTRPDRDDALGCRWLRAAMEMAAIASGSWPLSPDPGPQGWTCFPHIATRTQGKDARSLRAARDFTGAVLRRWGVIQRRDDIVVVVSELLTNAQRHALPGGGQHRGGQDHPGQDHPGQDHPGQDRAGRLIRLGLLCPGPCVLCAVADPSPVAPVPKDPGNLAETGRGLHVIASLSDKWGYTTYGTQGEAGKVVWAVFLTLPAVG